MKTKNRPEDILAVGIDPSKDTLGVAIMRFPEEVVFTGSVPNLPEAFDELMQAVQNAAGVLGLTPVYGLEDTGRFGKAFSAFLRRHGQTVKEVNPILTHHQRAFYGQDKSDGIDAKCAGAVVMRRLDRLPDRKTDSDLSQALKQLSAFRDKQVNLRVQLVNQLHFELEQTYMSVYQSFFTKLRYAVALAFFRKYPAPQMLKNTDAEQLDDFLKQAGRGRNKTTGEVILREAANVWGCPQAELQAAAHASIIVTLCDQISILNKSIRQLEKDIEKLVAKTGVPLCSVTGIDTVRAGVILGQTGDPARFASKHAYAKYNGTAPRIVATGKTIKHVKNTACNRALRKEFHQLALYMADHDPLSKEYVLRLTSAGKTKGQAVNRLARRLSDIVFAIMMSKTAYDPNIAMDNIERKNNKKNPLKAVS